MQLQGADKVFNPASLLGYPPLSISFVKFRGGTHGIGGIRAPRGWCLRRITNTERWSQRGVDWQGDWEENWKQIFWTEDKVVNDLSEWRQSARGRLVIPEANPSATSQEENEPICLFYGPDQGWNATRTRSALWPTQNWGRENQASRKYHWGLQGSFFRKGMDI